MNFLEQLAAEWYAYKGYFVRTNVKFGRREKGGWEGEIDVLAFQPVTGELIHVECSTDSDRWSQRQARVQKKFGGAAGYYEDLIGMRPRELRRVAIVGFAVTDAPRGLGDGIEHKTVPAFIREIYQDLSGKDPLKEAIPETLPLLRAIQFAARYGVKADQPSATNSAAGRESCLCGCGGHPKGRHSRYLPGHDARHRGAGIAQTTEVAEP